MRTLLRFVMCACAGGLVPAHAQVALPTANPQTQFSSGQDVVPVYEGWLQNKDSTFTFVFGYFNRNWKEELAIPAGPENKIEPGAPDRGQPTYFLPRRQSWVFRVTVPKDWGPTQDLIWTITAHGRTEKAYAQLLPEYQIIERLIMTRGNLNPGEDDPNKPPSITIAPITAATVGAPVTLTALVTDDGLPQPRPPRKPREGASTPAQTNNATERPKPGLAVSWFAYRGPAKVTFDTAGQIPVANGQAVVTAHFSAPGTYILQAVATDGALQIRVDVPITVQGGESRP